MAVLERGADGTGPAASAFAAGFGRDPERGLIAFASQLGLAITDDQVETMLRFLDMLYSANESLNLTRVPRETAHVRHLMESLAVLGAVPVASGSRILDLGSGGGLPGVPLAIAVPECRFVLMDARMKKVAFLESVIETLSLGNACAVHARAEDAGRDASMRHAFDLVVARAVAPLGQLVSWVEPFLTRSGVCAAMKSRAIDDEITAARGRLDELGLEIHGLERLAIPGQDAERVIVVLGRKKSRRGCGGLRH